MERLRGRRKTFVGTVVSDKMDKTVVVAVDRLVRHPLYKKVIRRTSKFYAHDERNECRIGDIVEIVETRPLSKLKRWRVVRIVQRAKVPLPVVREEVAEETEEQLLEEVLQADTAAPPSTPTAQPAPSSATESAEPSAGSEV
ncbi:30S ribosomal protein S17 [bacterium HR17]|uniref:Small ribosomal subunit protein uS17 n=1 Tax=Candidatus Fervidibacter japonicus TaxID=2035412 RepID=A0A2H5XDK2_9BACT|nr:30S ribosomal protein S17 [bacterium HR17]